MHKISGLTRAAVVLTATAASVVMSCALATEPSAPAAGGDSSKKLEAGLAPTIRLLQLMDTDKNGKVSKEEFMHFMEAEFTFADKNHDGELDPKELQHLLQGLRHPIEGPGR